MINYPIVQSPSVIQTLGFDILAFGRRKKTGASELVIYSRVLRLGLTDLREDVCLKIDGHRYEPDLAYIDRKRGIYIDIEIDEPYTGIERPTHYLTQNGSHKDFFRNEKFVNAGWYVLRFTERQMFCETKACMKVVYDLLLSLNAIDTIPASLQNVSSLQLEPAWTAEESKQRSLQRYRKTYLGYEPIHMDFSSNLKCCILIVQIIFQSITNVKVRKMLVKQLKNHFLK